jgi:hypothetical protein
MRGPELAILVMFIIAGVVMSIAMVANMGVL